MSTLRRYLGPAKENLRAIVGGVAEVVMPRLAREIDSGTRNGHSVKLKRAIVLARLRRAEKQKDAAMIENALMSFWRGESGDRFHTENTKNFQTWFRGPHYPIVDAVAEQVAANPNLRSFVEIGCGDGQVLAHFSERLAGIESFTGLDINAGVIARDAEVYAGRPNLQFIQHDARSWLAGHTADGMILMSYGGVMEYFSAAELSEIFARLRRCENTVVALVEPVEESHDLDRDPGSRVHGWERSFSHNYRALLTAAGFAFTYDQELTVGRFRWLLLVAVPNT